MYKFVRSRFNIIILNERIKTLRAYFVNNMSN